MSFAQIPENKLYIVTATYGTSILTSSGASIEGDFEYNTVLRDMGTTVVMANGDILRKVQEVNSDNDGTIGYIKLAAVSGEGTSDVARLN